MKNKAGLLALSILLPLCVHAEPPQKPYWLEAMKNVHAGFDGTPGYIAQLGDSITYSMAFWSPMGWMDPDSFLTEDDGLPKRPSARWRDTIKGVRAKGTGHGNYSGWRVGNLLSATPAVLQREKPEMAIVMIGTNDTGPNGPPANYGENLERLLKMIMDANCIPILNTIPPRRGRMEGVDKTNEIIRDLAKQLKVPLVDYHAEILKRQPGNAWDGTLISRDGVHPSGGKSGDFSEDNLSQSGYALRNWLNFLAVREVYFRVTNEP